MDRAEELEQFFNNLSLDLMCVASTDGHLKRVNKAWERVLGHPASELVGRPYLELVHPDDVERTAAEARRLAGGATAVSFENRYRCRDGSYRWLSWNATASPAEGLIFAVARDITAGHAAGDALNRLAAIIEATDDAVIGTNLDGTIISWNPAAERIYGYRADGAIGQNIRLIFSADQQRQVDGILARVAAGKTVRELDSVRTGRDGARVHVALAICPVRDARDRVIGAAAVAHDITRRKIAEERFHRLVRAAPDAIVIVNAAGEITLVSEQTERLFGYSEAELIGQPVEILVPPGLGDKHRDHRRAYMARPEFRGMGVGLELSGLRRDGTQFPVEISLAPLDTDEGMQVSAAIRDITDRRQIEEALAAARDEALAAARHKSEFLAMVSHEIRTPMNGVLGLSGLLLETDLEPRQHRYAKSIQASAKALLTVINDVLDFSKVEAGKITLVSTDFDLGRLIEEVGIVAAEAACDKQLETITFYPADLPTAVHADEGRLRQVLLNLASNAVKFTDQGEVLLRADLDHPGQDGTPRYTFTVADTGIGISEADQARLFQPFTQADTTTTRRYGGTGLGLTISLKLVELMGGQITVSSKPGHGSRFCFTIPLPPQPAAPAHPRRPNDQFAGQRLLIVDDNATSRTLIAEHTRAWGMTPTLACDSQSAQTQLRQAAMEGCPYDILVLDHEMPGIDGVELAVQVTRDPAIPSPLLILLTNRARDYDRFCDLPHARVLSKPVGPSSLYDTLLNLLVPQAAVASSQYRRRRDASPPGGHHLVLLAEDNEINQLVAVDNLRLLGYQVDIASNGLEAVQLGSAKPYLAILMDCQMPIMDGFEATRELRRQEAEGQHIPIIAMTAGALAEDRQHCLDAGMDDYLSKPIDGDDLRTVLSRWIPASSAKVTLDGPQL